jgi:hypothetical protein
MKIEYKEDGKVITKEVNNVKVHLNDDVLFKIRKEYGKINVNKTAYDGEGSIAITPNVSNEIDIS